MTRETNNSDLRELGARLRQLGHDLRGVLGVLKLEVFSVREVGVDVRSAFEGGDLTAVLAALLELEEIATSLRAASDRGTTLADDVHALGVALQDRVDPPMDHGEMAALSAGARAVQGGRFDR